ncbi:hypothetical protein PV08_08169 [Exophiala spinifera]|uniref:Uncharacterized protein n=1 Tax=Exophiala spinifera TaxID=91928 RepID=A0A0D1ZJK1_9EURO|nr:uncharacterized protein PV08_08169 [Exophiala spinifera]KIW12982.1 hypothetical protein PV08_08169 [Exophiala spinifera]
MPSEKHNSGSNAARSNTGSRKASNAAPSQATHHTHRVREICQVIPAPGYNKPPGACVAAMHPCYRPLDLGTCNAINSQNGVSRMYNSESITNTRVIETIMKPEDYNKLSEGNQKALATANWTRHQSSNHRLPGQAAPPPPPHPPPPPPSASVKVIPPAPSVRDITPALAPAQPPPPPPPPASRSAHTAVRPPPPPPPPLPAGQGGTASLAPLPKSKAPSKAPTTHVHKVDFVPPKSHHSAAVGKAATLTPSDSISNRSARTKPATVKNASVKGTTVAKPPKDDTSCELCHRGFGIPQVDGVRICSGCVQSHRFLVAQSSGNRR